MRMVPGDAEKLALLNPKTSASLFFQECVLRQSDDYVGISRLYITPGSLGLGVYGLGFRAR